MSDTVLRIILNIYNKSEERMNFRKICSDLCGPRIPLLVVLNDYAPSTCYNLATQKTCILAYKDFLLIMDENSKSIKQKQEKMEFYSPRAFKSR